jgi:DNA-binding transcriptional regulator WhiA
MKNANNIPEQHRKTVLKRVEKMNDVGKMIFGYNELKKFDDQQIQKNPKNPAKLYQKFSEIVQAAPHIHSCDASARQQERKENRAYNAFRKACEALGLNHIEEAKKYGKY